MASPTARPELSVIVATRERRELMLRCLESLRDQRASPDSFEAIVADDGSRDGTASAVEDFSAPFSIRCLRLARGGQATARNAAAEVARGSVLLFIDDDVIAGPDLVAEHLRLHVERQDAVGVGFLEQAAPKQRGEWYGRAFASSWNRRYDDLGNRTLDWTACFTGNLSVPRKSFAALGGFATDLPVSEDTELGYRLEVAGCVPRFLPRAHAIHDDQKRWRRLLADAWREGSGTVDLVDRNPGMTAGALGWFNATSRREVLLRRLLLALRVPPAWLVPFGRLLPGEGRKQVWFSLVSRLAFWRAVRRSVSRERWQQLTWGVPVLMYHAFGREDEGDRYVVSRRAFAWQLRLLRLLRYRGVGFGELAAELRAGRLPARRTVAITIDDGYLDNLEIALPLLRRHRFPATIFIVSGKLGGVNDWTEEGALARRPLLTAEQVRELADAGIEIGAHTRGHFELPSLDDEQVGTEIAGSKDDLEQLLGTPIETFAYPYGRHDERAVAAAGSAGFVGAAAVVPRLARPLEDPLLIPRVEVRAEDSLRGFLVHVLFGAV